MYDFTSQGSSSMEFPSNAVPAGSATTATTTIGTSTTSGGGRGPPITVEAMSQRDIAERDVEYNLRDFTKPRLWAMVIALFLGEFFIDLLVYTMQLGAGMTGMGVLGRSLIQFSVLVASTSVFARYNVGHLDPLITLQLVVVGKFGLPWYFMFAHLLAQALAALVATLLTWALTPGNDRSLGLGFVPLAFGYTPGQGLGFQFLGCLLIFTIILWMVCAENKETFYMHTGSDFKQNTLFSLAVGSAHLTASLAFGKAVGHYFNWYLYFFPGTISGLISSSDWWPFFLGPLLAAIVQIAMYFFWHYINDVAYPPTYLQKVHHHLQ